MASLLEVKNLQTQFKTEAGIVEPSMGYLTTSKSGDRRPGRKRLRQVRQPIIRDALSALRKMPPGK
jgi:hypothetical protein